MQNAYKLGFIFMYIPILLAQWLYNDTKIECKMPDFVFRVCS